jgi:hypothetical protein
MNGSDNDSGNGGSGINMLAGGPSGGPLFPRAGVNLATGGLNTHTHTTDPISTGITVDDHADHAHSVPLSTTKKYLDGVSNFPRDDCTSGVKVPGCGAPSVLSHGVDDPGHSHDVNDGPNVPEFQEFHFIERIDNSV